jgi:hypothetical protein
MSFGPTQTFPVYPERRKALDQAASANSRISVYLTDPYGNKLIEVSTFQSLSYGRVVNQPSWLTLEFTSNSVPIDMVRIDGFVEVWRRPSLGDEVLDGESIWLIQTINRSIDQSGSERIIIEAVHPLWLIGSPGRFVINHTESREANKQGYADNILKEIMREQTGEFASVSRRYPWVIDNDTSQSVIISRACAYENVLDILRSICDSITEALPTEYLAFDIVKQGSQLVFRTYVGQRGVDRRLGSAAPLYLGIEHGNINGLSLTRDYRDEVNAAVVGGRGEGVSRQIERLVSPTYAEISPWHYREIFINAQNATLTSELVEEGRAAIRRARPRIVAEAQIINTPQSQYGVHWGFGDFVTLSAFGLNLPVRIDAVAVSFNSGEETITAAVRFDSREFPF